MSIEFNFNDIPVNPLMERILRERERIQAQMNESFYWGNWMRGEHSFHEHEGTTTETNKAKEVDFDNMKRAEKVEPPKTLEDNS